MMGISTRSIVIVALIVALACIGGGSACADFEARKVWTRDDVVAAFSGLVSNGLVVEDMLQTHAAVFGPAVNVSAAEVKDQWQEHLQRQRDALQPVVTATWNLFVALLREPHRPHAWLTTLPYIEDKFFGARSGEFCSPPYFRPSAGSGEFEALPQLPTRASGFLWPLLLPGGNVGFFTDGRVDLYDALAAFFEQRGFKVAHAAYASQALSSSLGVHTKYLVISML